MAGAKIVQFHGGPTDEAEIYVGPSREVIVDTGVGTVRVQDGITPGGHALARADLANTLAPAAIDIRNIVVIFEQNFALLSPRDPNTLYFVTEATLQANGGTYLVIGEAVTFTVF